ncbi:hypothetical protein [Roseimicrobium sp. ORNL1]|uniref:hypothetical protein n=1 Tax=Roseimicrobium sp. ORNL1 TaxID=2711231 RepID=UPI0013E1BF3E|nr:hypothetical protein [Roseimicrobium sp. ORNL1]QIF01316.1 hypothetical protein G5S37_07205 [Roseimicrobium sp. ORNL1]
MFIFVVAFALLAIPLARLTFARVDEKPVHTTSKVEMAASEKVPTFIRVRLAHVPTSLSLKVDGHELLAAEQQKPKETDISFNTEIAIPADGLEILATATWPEGTPDTALTLDLEPSEKENRSLTNWSAGNQLSAAYTFHW